MKRERTEFLHAVVLLCAVFVSSEVWSQTGSISGRVTFTGTPPKETTFKHNISTESCGKQVDLDRLVIGKNKGVQYTLLYLKNPPAGSTNGMKPAVIDQKNCRYTPHMSIAAKGSTLEMVNSDPLLHTSHGYLYTGMERSTAFNIAQPIAGQRTQQQLRKAGMLEIECDAGHVWMSCWVWVTPSPFAAITNEDGDFLIENVPAGTYSLIMWHEGWKIKSKDAADRPKFSDPIAEEREVMVTAGKTTIINFELR